QASAMSLDSKLQQSTTGPLVFGVGLMRTGTNSQMKALEILLGGRCYHMFVIMKQKRHHLKLWNQAAKEGLTKQLADQIFDGFVATTDFPVAAFYPELLKIYPNAKFVLSVRDPQRWVESVRSTIFKGMKAMGCMLAPSLWLLNLTYFLPLHHNIFDSRLGIRVDMTDKELIEAFNRHTEAVIRTIPKERLLVFRVSDGWEPLCNFLELPVPDVPFPNVNDTAEFQKKAIGFYTISALANFGFCSAVGLAVWFGLKCCLRRFA
ncbi:hypothetical protein BOX15_Mlig001041g1, partial [Macrostomum lignano]